MSGPQPRPPETLPEPSGAGSVVLDIGGDLGAAVVMTPEELDGQELEIRPELAEWTGRHVAVRPRPLGERVLYAAVFPSLLAGEYRVRERPMVPGGTELVILVIGGQVTETRWPGLS